MAILPPTTRCCSSPLAPVDRSPATVIVSASSERWTLSACRSQSRLCAMAKAYSTWCACMSRARHAADLRLKRGIRAHQRRLSHVRSGGFGQLRNRDALALRILDLLGKTSEFTIIAGRDELRRYLEGARDFQQVFSRGAELQAIAAEGRIQHLVGGTTGHLQIRRQVNAKRGAL